MCKNTLQQQYILYRSKTSVSVTTKINTLQKETRQLPQINTAIVKESTKLESPLPAEATFFTYYILHQEFNFFKINLHLQFLFLTFLSQFFYRSLRKKELHKHKRCATILTIYKPTKSRNNLAELLLFKLVAKGPKDLRVSNWCQMPQVNGMPM